MEDTKDIKNMSDTELYFEACSGLVCPFPTLNANLYVRSVGDGPIPEDIAELYKKTREKRREYNRRKREVAAEYTRRTGNVVRPHQV